MVALYSGYWANRSRNACVLISTDSTITPSKSKITAWGCITLFPRESSLGLLCDGRQLHSIPLQPPLCYVHIEMSVHVTTGNPGAQDRSRTLAHPPPWIRSIAILDALFAERPDTLIIVVCLGV